MSHKTFSLSLYCTVSYLASFSSLFLQYLQMFGFKCCNFSAISRCLFFAFSILITFKFHLCSSSFQDIRFYFVFILLGGIEQTQLTQTGGRKAGLPLGPLRPIFSITKQTRKIIHTNSVPWCVTRFLTPFFMDPEFI